MALSTRFGPLLRERRQAVGLTLEQLAEQSGVSVRAISDMERGRSRGPQARTVEALADALGLIGNDRSDLVDAAGRGRSRATLRPRSTLPPVDDLFVGRSAERRRLSAALIGAGGSRPVVVSGPGGLGKTALAVRSARDVEARFPDGIVFLPLCGSGAAPVSAAVAAGRVLQLTGTARSAVPRRAEDRFAAVSGRLAAGRMLLILDDAGDEAQVRRLLGHREGSAVLVTSRRALSGLEASDRFPLSPLTAADASALLGQILRDAQGDPARLDELATECGRFPLALRIVANRLLSRPGWSVQTMIERLADESARLSRLRAGDVRVETAFEMSYRQLRPREQMVFRRMALVDHDPWGLGSASVLTGLDEAAVDEVLDDLVELGLVVAVGGNRYAFHDLIRLFARARLAADEAPDTVERARAAHHSWLLATTVAADM
jgi:transcriptional regulator with XRE-family HTH domain